MRGSVFVNSAWVLEGPWWMLCFLVLLLIECSLILQAVLFVFCHRYSAVGIVVIMTIVIVEREEGNLVFQESLRQHVLFRFCWLRRVGV